MSPRRSAAWLRAPFVLCVAAGAGYLVVLALRLRDLYDILSWDSDAASAMVVGHAMHAGNAGLVFVSNQSNYIPLAFDDLIAGIAGHQVIAQAAGLVVTVATVLLIAAALWRATRSRWVVSVCLVVAAATGPAVLGRQLPLDYHGATFCATALAGFYVVDLAAARRRPSLRALHAIAMTVVLAAVVASDRLAIATAIVPLALAPLLLARLRGRPTWAAAGVALAVATAGLVAGTAVDDLLLEHGFARFPLMAAPIGPISTLGQLATNAGLLGGAILHVGEGVVTTAGAGQPWQSGLRVGGAVMIAALLALLAAAGRAVVDGLAARHRSRRPPAEAAASGATGAVPDAWAGLVLFWTISSLALFVSFLLFRIALDFAAYRYVIGLLEPEAVGVAVLIGPLAAGLSRARVGPLRAVGGAATCVAVGVAALASAHQVATTTDHTATLRPPQTLALPRAIASLATRHLAYGYADYWDALNVTFRSDYRLTVTPVYAGPACGDTYCRGADEAVGAWYRGDHPGPSFVLLDPEQPIPDALPAVFGPPSAVYHVDRFTIAVYPYDVASRFVTVIHGN